MRKCDTCQIKIDDGEKNCPICGKEIEGYEFKEAHETASPEKAPLYETGRLDFHGWFKNLLQQPAFAAVVLSSAINTVFGIILCFFFGMPTFMDICSVLIGIISVIPIFMLYMDRHNRAGTDKSIRAVSFLKIISIIQLIFIVLMIVLFIIAAAMIVLTGTKLFSGILPIEFYFLADENVYIAGAALFAGAIFAAAVSLPFAICPVLITSDILSGLKNNSILKIRGAMVFRVYNTIMLVLGIILALGSATMFETPVFALVYLISIISGVLPGFLLSGLISRLDNIVKVEHWKNTFKKQ